MIPGMPEQSSIGFLEDSVLWRLFELINVSPTFPSPAARDHFVRLAHCILRQLHKTKSALYKALLEQNTAEPGRFGFTVRW